MGSTLIAGCGDVGTALGLGLCARGRRVVGLRRRAEGLPRPLEPFSADLCDAGSLRALPGDVDAVVYVAAAEASTDEAYRRAYVDGVRCLGDVLGAAGAPVGRLVYVSSTAVYGQSAGEWVDEDSPTVPRRFNGSRLLEGEAAARAWGVPVTVVRFGGIYGPGRTALIERVRAGAACAAHPPLYTNRIHRDDCAGFLAHLLAMAEPAGCYVGVDDAPAAQCEVMGWIARRIGAPPPRPGAAARAGSKRCSNRRLRGTGYALLYPTYREGYAELLAAGSGHS